MKWQSFTPVQDQTIPAIINSDNDVVISSGTASGKTEAAFFPILTKVENEAQHSLKVLYISPLKALINNQFERVIDLCKDMDISINRWHGDISSNKKKKFINHPTGILQITPESLESLFINRTNFLSRIFKDVEFIIIDEVHSFIGSERGVHLRALIDRLEHYFSEQPRIVGLSATLGNFEVVCEWIRRDTPKDVEIIESKGYDKKLLYSLMYFDLENMMKPIELFEDIRALTKQNKSIIFCNSRSDVEELTHFLNRLAEKEGRGETYYAHHSSIDKNWREHVEKMMIKSNTPTSVISTSTLELGIDIGDVDIVIQVDNTFTVSSLKQRLGRSGRKKGSDQVLQMYSMKEDSLLQSIAVMELNLQGWVEPAKLYSNPYDIVFHQIISICAEFNGLTIEELIEKINDISPFKALDQSLVHHLIYYMIEHDILEILRGSKEIIVGLEGERILRSKEFYAVFSSPEELTVRYKARKIGMLDKNPTVQPGNNIILAGKLWTISEVDYERKAVYVKVAVNGKPPMYSSGTGNIHPHIHEKMMAILCSDEKYDYISQRAVNVLSDIRRKYQFSDLSADERPIWLQKDKVLFETFSGTVIANTIFWMLKVIGMNVKKIDPLGRIEIEPCSDIKRKFLEISTRTWNEEDILSVTKKHELFVSKYSIYLPTELIYEIHKAHNIDLQGALTFLQEKTLKFIEL